MTLPTTSSEYIFLKKGGKVTGTIFFSPLSRHPPCIMVQNFEKKNFVHELGIFWRRGEFWKICK